MTSYFESVTEILTLLNM